MSAQTSRYAGDELPTGTVDVVVIGGGAAGLNGALVSARSRRSVVVIDSGTPRNAPAAAMHGFVVLDGTPQPEILERGRRPWQAPPRSRLRRRRRPGRQRHRPHRPGRRPAAAGALADSRINAVLAAADTNAALAAVQKTTA